ncbi:MAG: helix-turn-helix transcriptional regulator [Desulfitobacteriaceae bacterium]|nr:helix-turn-helix transcriptional regulator [Desulfitobacteriaceae bacterium]
MSKNTFEIKKGTLYVVLKRLENNHLVMPYWDDTKTGGGRRRYYKITDQGMGYLTRKKDEWVFFRAVIDTFFEEV